MASLFSSPLSSSSSTSALMDAQMLLVSQNQFSCIVISASVQLAAILFFISNNDNNGGHFSHYAAATLLACSLLLAVGLVQLMVVKRIRSMFNRMGQACVVTFSVGTLFAFFSACSHWSSPSNFVLSFALVCLTAAYVVYKTLQVLRSS
jgi:hypothetical protein